MKLTIEIPDDLIDAVREAFLKQDKPATDEQLAGDCYAYLLGTSAYVHEGAVRAAVSKPIAAAGDLELLVTKAQRLREAADASSKVAVAEPQKKV